MKFAIKRTWPDKPKTWERQGEGESLEAFALAFASDAGLGVGTELMVVQKDSDDPAVELYRVVSTEPYALGPPQAHGAGAVAAASASEPAAPSRPYNPDDYKVGITAVGATMWSLGRPFLVAFGIAGVLILLMKYGSAYF